MADPNKPDRQREAIARIRDMRLALDALARMIAELPKGEALEDALALVSAAHGALTRKPDHRRNMELCDAIGLVAASGIEPEGEIGSGWGFEPAAFRAAVVAWRAPMRRGRGGGQRRILGRLVHEALRSAGATPPSPESLLKQHERWRKARGRQSPSKRDLRNPIS
jgi:hypothetical protein